MNPNNQYAMNGFRANNGASTSSQNFNDFHPQPSNQPPFNASNPHLHPSQSVQQRATTHNGWQQHAMQMNTPHMGGAAAPPIPSQNQTTFNPGLWGNQIPIPQSFPPGMNPMGNFNIPFLPQQLIQEAYAMSVPVEASDEPTLLSKLLDSRRRSESYKDALNSLHGKNGHSASLWKDYYLDHKERLDSWIAMCLQKEKENSVSASYVQRSASSDVERVKTSLPTVKKPSPASFKREPSLPTSASRVSISAPLVKRPQKRSSQSTPPVAKEQSQSGRRSTINSLTAPSPVYGDRLPAPHAEIKIPDPPSRSPSPPTNVIPHRGRGNKYTNEDRDFFIKFVGWRLKQDPSLTRHDICDLLAEKAPHHSAQSWASHWSNNHDLPDKILAAARGEDYDLEEDSSSEEEEMAVRRRPKYKDPSTSEESESEQSEDEKEEQGDDEEDDRKPIRHYTEEEMGQKGAPFTEADIYITAKYIASFPQWDDASAKERWEPFVQRYSQRSAKSWGEYYRRNEHTLLKLARKIKEEATVASTSSIATQCARPTQTLPKAKRKFAFDSNDETLVKRGRPIND